MPATTLMASMTWAASPSTTPPACGRSTITMPTCPPGGRTRAILPGPSVVSPSCGSRSADARSSLGITPRTLAYSAHSAHSAHNGYNAHITLCARGRRVSAVSRPGAASRPRRSDRTTSSARRMSWKTPSDDPHRCCSADARRSWRLRRPSDGRRTSAIASARREWLDVRTPCRRRSGSIPRSADPRGGRDQAPCGRTRHRFDGAERRCVVCLKDVRAKRSPCLKARTRPSRA